MINANTQVYRRRRSVHVHHFNKDEEEYIGTHECVHVEDAMNHECVHVEDAMNHECVHMDDGLNHKCIHIKDAIQV